MRVAKNQVRFQYRSEDGRKTTSEPVGIAKSNSINDVFQTIFDAGYEDALQAEPNGAFWLDKKKLNL